MLKKFIKALVICTASTTLLAQRGDKPGEEQQALVPRDTIPPSPVLSPKEALKSFKLPEGFEMTLVASEPLVEAPVALNFDPDGRLWVVEMRGFMPNADGVGETEPVGRISVLEDTNGDWQMDKSTVFLDNLVLPRAILLVRNGALVAEPPNLWFWRDINGDGKADEKHLVSNEYATQADPKLGDKMNPEHASNSLMWALDNWIYSANHTTRFKNVAGHWQSEPTIFRGQWGLTQDDFGRLFFNSNSDQLRGDVVPAEYLKRNANYAEAAGANVKIASDQTVWPGRINPGVNRGYQKGVLKKDGTLAVFTGACGPVIYRGSAFPKEFSGNAFLCEPTGNLIRRNILIEKEIQITATNAYHEAEFLTSTDERFRPVNLHNGPDGSLYVVDMYHGIIQHRFYLTTYLRNQALSRGLDKPANCGRIYRIAHKSQKPSKQPRLSSATSEELVKALTHENGWWRDAAQQLLVERADLSVLPELKKLVASGSNPLGQIHALWVLDGLGEPDMQSIHAAMNSKNAKVRATAVRLSERFFETPFRSASLGHILKLQNDPSADVQLQLAFTLGQIRDDQAEAALATLLRHGRNKPFIRDACLSGLGGRELEFLERLIKDSEWRTSSEQAQPIFKALAKCVFTERKPERISRMFEFIPNIDEGAAWQKAAILDGVLSTAPAPGKNKAAAQIKPVEFSSQPSSLIALTQVPDKELQSRAEKVSELVTWPGKTGAAKAEGAKPLTPDEKALFEEGKELYISTCGACHQPHGNGIEGLAPPLTDSEWVLGSEGRLIRISLQGVRGPITVKGRVYEMEMPPMSVLDDKQMAAILTYVRREWGHSASPVSVQAVAKVRAETEKREEAWTEAELQKIP